MKISIYLLAILFNSIAAYSANNFQWQDCMTNLKMISWSIFSLSTYLLDLQRELVGLVVYAGGANSLSAGSVTDLVRTSDTRKPISLDGEHLNEKLFIALIELLDDKVEKVKKDNSTIDELNSFFNKVEEQLKHYPEEYEKDRHEKALLLWRRIIEKAKDGKNPFNPHQYPHQ